MKTKDKKPKIGVDVDDVLLECVRYFLEIYQKEHGKKIDYQDMTSYYCPKHLKISKKQLEELFDKFKDNGYADDPEILRGSKEALKKLAKKYQIIFITFRPPRIKEATFNILKKHLKEIEFEVYHARDFLGVKTKTKADICEELGIFCLVDDNLNAILDCASRGIKGILFNHPWNQDCEEHKNIFRVKNWKEIVKKIEEISKNEQ